MAALRKAKVPVAVKLHSRGSSTGKIGVLALVLSALGLYGITAYSATRRRMEIGVRTALGAERTDVIAMIVRQSILLTAVGLALGLAGAAVITRYLAGMLFGLRPLDPITFIAGTLLFLAIATLAAYPPARRAARVDPLVALRL